MKQEIIREVNNMDIKNNVNEDYVDKSERLMKELAKYVTTSKIRDLLSQVNELYNDIILDTREILDDKYVEAIRHLKVKMIYDAGRDRQQNPYNKKHDDIKLEKGRLTYFYKELFGGL